MIRLENLSSERNKISDNVWFKKYFSIVEDEDDERQIFDIDSSPVVKGKRIKKLNPTNVDWSTLPKYEKSEIWFWIVEVYQGEDKHASHWTAYNGSIARKESNPWEIMSAIVAIHVLRSENPDDIDTAQAEAALNRAWEQDRAIVYADKAAAVEKNHFTIAVAHSKEEAKAIRDILLRKIGE